MGDENLLFVIRAESMPYVVCPASLVGCSETTLLDLAVDLERLVVWDRLGVEFVPAAEFRLPPDDETDGCWVDGLWADGSLWGLHAPLRQVIRGECRDIVAAGVGGAGFPRLLKMALQNDDDTSLALRCLDLRMLAPGELDADPEFAGDPPLHVACQWGQAEVVRRLAGGGHAVRAPGGTGNTPLHVAARAGRAEVVALLLSLGADPLARDGDGRTPLSLAKLRCPDARRPAVEALLWPIEWPAAARRRAYLQRRADGTVPNQP